MAYWQLAPFFPEFIHSKEIGKMWVGIAMSTYAVMFLLSSIFTGHILLKYIKRIDGCFLGASFVVSGAYIFENLKSIAFKNI